MKKRIKKSIIYFMLVALFSSYSMPLISYADEVGESSEAYNAPESSSEIDDSDLHSDSVNEEEIEEVEKTESSESYEEDKSTELEKKNEKQEEIERNITSNPEIDDEKVQEESHKVDSQTSDQGSDEQTYETTLEIRETEYEATIVNEEYILFSAPGTIEGAKETGFSKEYINENVSVKTEADTETATWANIYLEEENIGWINIDALKENVTENVTTFAMTKAAAPSISYSSHVQTIGWQDAVKNGNVSGTTGKNKRLEAIKVNINDLSGLNVEYSSHVQSNGWMNWVSNGQLSGTTGQNKCLEAIKIKLSGEQAKNYDVYYRVHAQSLGWLDWAKNGEEAGTAGLAKRLEAIEIVLVEKGGKAPGSTNTPFVEKPSVNYQTHVQSVGWQNPVKDGQLAGTEGQKKRIEAIKVDINNIENLGVKYSSHVQGNGWMNWVSDGQISGTTGGNKRLEAIKMQLTGSKAQNYDIYYRVHSEHFGWLGWAKNGEIAGLEGYSFRAEAIQVRVLPKGDNSISTSDDSYYKFTAPTVVYSSHIQSSGWLLEAKNGQASGTTGQEKRLEAIKISLKNTPFKGNIVYKSHVQKDGWQDTVQNGQLSGTTGQEKRLEAIEITLTGDMAKYYDVYYRTHIQSHGWLGWAKNGMQSGSEGIAKRIEAVEIKLVKKNAGSAVNAEAAFKKAEEKNVIYLDAGHGGYESGAAYYGTQEKILNLSVAKKVKSRLEKMGYVVIMSRTTDERITLIDRAKEANNSGADIFVSVHHNAMPRNSSVSGIETYYYEYDPNYQPQINPDMHNHPGRVKESAELAAEIHEALIDNTGAVDRGVRRNTFAVLRETIMPAVLLELGYMSSPAEIAKLKTDSYQNKLADSVAEGIHNYFK